MSDVDRLKGRIEMLASHIMATDPEPATLPGRQVAALVDEAGELLHEVRRVYANTRTRGSIEEIAGEAADVILALHVTARVLGIEFPALVLSLPEPRFMIVGAGPLDQAVQAIRTCTELMGDRGPRKQTFEDIQLDIRVLAWQCKVDLRAAVESKLAIVEERLGVPKGGGES